MPDCLIGADAAPDAIPVHALSPETLDGFLAGDGTDIAGFARAAGFKAAAGSLLTAPRGGGIGCVLFGLGKEPDRPPLLAGRLATGLPAGDFALAGGFPDDGLATLAFAFGSEAWGLVGLLGIPLSLLVAWGFYEAVEARMHKAARRVHRAVAARARRRAGEVAP